MTILSLLQSDNIEPKRVTAQEMAGPCPACGGKDRFRIWPEKGRWWCRGCDKSGDEIEYLREFRGLSFADSCSFLGRELPERERGKIEGKREFPALRKPWEPKPDKTPSEAWREKSGAFVVWCHEQLLKNISILQWLEQERGLTLETVKAGRLGWNSGDIYRDRGSWGLEPEKKPDGTFKKLWLPAGLVIPTFRGETLLRVRVRRHELGEGQRYIFVSGGSSGPMIFGEDRKNMVVVESELDAILLNQEAGDICGVVALGNAQTRPDIYTTSLLLSAEKILVSLDSDEAGAKEAWQWWKENFRNSKRWAIIEGKDPGEAKRNGLPLREWIIAGLPDTLDEGLSENSGILESQEPAKASTTGTQAQGFLPKVKRLSFEEQIELLRWASRVADRAGEGSETWDRISELFDKAGILETHFESLAKMLEILSGKGPFYRTWEKSNAKELRFSILAN